jgi:NADP-dependent 3-hydroxy acid dehydrogenase YdfG
VGSAVAREFAEEGAEVFLSGRSKSNVEETARQIEWGGGIAHAASLDALDGGAVSAYVDAIVQQHGPIDVVFNATGPLARDYGSGKNAVDLSVDQFMVPLVSIVKSQFITARAALRHMVRQHSGVIIILTGSPARAHVEGATAIGAAFGALETLAENLALEVGTDGVRVVCLRTTANIGSRTIRETMDSRAAKMNITQEQSVARIAGLVMHATAGAALD